MTWQKAGPPFCFRQKQEMWKGWWFVCWDPKNLCGAGKGLLQRLAQGSKGLCAQLQALTLGLAVSGRGRAGKGRSCSVLQAYLGMDGRFGPDGVGAEWGGSKTGDGPAVSYPPRGGPTPSRGGRISPPYVPGTRACSRPAAAVCPAPRPRRWCGCRGRRGRCARGSWRWPGRLGGPAGSTGASAAAPPPPPPSSPGPPAAPSGRAGRPPAPPAPARPPAVGTWGQRAGRQGRAAVGEEACAPRGQLPASPLAHFWIRNPPTS